MKVRVVDVYPYRLKESKIEYLLLRRSGGVSYAGQWRMIGGKIESGETAWQTALREVLEETGLHPVNLWTIPSANTFYEWQHDRMNVIPAFAAELTGEPVTDHEHEEYGWFDVAEAVERLRWPEQRRLLELSSRMVREGVPPELVVRIEAGLAW